jgi:hypothetical protein
MLYEGVLSQDPGHTEDFRISKLLILSVRGGVGQVGKHGDKSVREAGRRPEWGHRSRGSGDEPAAGLGDRVGIELELLGRRVSSVLINVWWNDSMILAAIASELIPAWISAGAARNP